MKKIIALTLTFILVFSLVSCKLAEKEEAEPTAIPTEEPTPEPSPTVLYICDLHGLENDENMTDIGDLHLTPTFRRYINDPKYADYSFCFLITLITPRLSALANGDVSTYDPADDADCVEQEVNRLKELGYDVWIVGKDKTKIRGIATQKQLQEFPYDRSSFAYRMHLSTNVPFEDVEKYYKY